MTEHTGRAEISAELLAEAQRMEIDAITIAERAIVQEIKARQATIDSDQAARRWQHENKDSIAWSNKRLEEHGFPFPQYPRY